MAHDAYLQPYRESIERHGLSFEATLWASRATQRIRFKTFTEMCFFAGKRVLDAGCGQGDFAEYLLDHDVAFERFIGVDALPPVIEEARHRGYPQCEFHLGDLLRDETLFTRGEPDIICISGTLNTMTDADAFQLLESAWRAAGEALTFNFLSDRCGPGAPPQFAPARRLSTMRLLDWAMSRSCLVCYRQDYFESGHDGTILMRKGE